jgi:hypothetical protein
VNFLIVKTGRRRDVTFPSMVLFSEIGLIWRECQPVVADSFRMVCKGRIRWRDFESHFVKFCRNWKAAY